MSLFKRLYRWVDLRVGIGEIADKELTGYLLPRNINAWYSLGSVLMVAFAIQVVTGMLLLVYYVPDAEKAFKSVNFIMNEVPFGWLIRLCHAVGSNTMIAALILHMLSTLVMGSYKSPRELNWLSGFLLFTLVQGISLTGYLAPWSQLSFWATTVATNSVSALPVAGPGMVEFLRGGKLVGPATLGRFFALHVAFLPLVISVVIVVHIFLLKRTGISAPPFGRSDTKTPWQAERYRYQSHPGGIPFFPNYMLEDTTSICIYLAIFLGVVFFWPSMPFTPDAFVPADPFKTPAHIKPEWYFLANYQTLKIFPNELLGLTVQGAAMTLLALLPFADRSPERHPLKRPLFLALVVGGILLWIALSVWGHLS
ncbi:menaquinol oxidoreductase complex Cbc3, cytochrome b subunit, putative [Citrifermentans bemidjiense Bem]|uniref:Menaquinol oxidoreductase complex Cbc3, cytochrome b subunit, putative n=1 Tax=Citrifermentans bemidjiense (strain ATCC BAA-1014 / DSM 16622 / JCM 12645 / Bem) TaxID=404380 RepID=B5EH05_CITBB|nr:cytochrome bc complex cytochrome b subunit [Citrifermentans bemidjiense]ACH38107.1 menaquinol oxidoreductase complex Cbc3, cytochrome b subunit, putative [Citrifermentans bemidjiense Bem]